MLGDALAALGAERGFTLGKNLLEIETYDEGFIPWV
jgi:hypothetical protein